MHAATKRMADVDDFYKDSRLKSLGEQWALSIIYLFEGVDNPDLMSLSKLWEEIEDVFYDGYEEMHLRMEKEIEDTEFRLKRGYDLGRFDQFWDDRTLFQCRYSRSKWLNFNQASAVPLEVYLHALKENKNIIHISFSNMNSDFDVNLFLCDLPWVTSMSPDPSLSIPAVRRDLLFIKSNDLNTFTKEIKLNPSSTYFFLDVRFLDDYSGLRDLGKNLISFVAPKSGEILILRVKHFGNRGEPLEVTLGSTKIQLNPPSEWSLTIDGISLCPIGFSGPSDLSFEPEVRNDIVIRFIGSNKYHGHYLRDIELLDEDDLEYMQH